MIRPVNETDCTDISRLILQLDPVDTIHDNRLKEKIGKMNAMQHMRLFGYEEYEKIIGMCTIGKIEGLSQKLRPFAVIENVVVDDSFRCRGIGRKLVLHAIDQAKQWNCYKVILGTGTKQDWKLKFYENCGFTKGEKTTFIKRLR
jgi:GNAT superfamily N-acetyltransferase